MVELAGVSACVVDGGESSIDLDSFFSLVDKSLVDAVSGLFGVDEVVLREGLTDATPNADDGIEVESEEMLDVSFEVGSVVDGRVVGGVVDSSPVVASVADGRVVAGVVDSSPVVTSVVDGRVVAGVVDSSAVVSSRSLLLFVSNKPVSQNSHNPCGFDFAQPLATEG